MITDLSRNRQVVEYISTLFCSESEELSFVRNNSLKIALKPIAVSSQVGKMLTLLSLLQKPKKILEIGTLGGYSALCLAKGMQSGGKLITLECEKERVLAARAHFQETGFDDRIEVVHGDATELMQQMIANGETPFDLIFVDADKKHYAQYLDLSIALSRSGTLILCDNLIPKRGEIQAPDPRDQEALAIYAFNRFLTEDPRVETMLFPTLSSTGSVDALGVLIVK